MNGKTAKLINRYCRQFGQDPNKVKAVYWGCPKDKKEGFKLALEMAFATKQYWKLGLE